MNKKLLIVGIAVLLLSVGFSGCTETNQDTTDDTNGDTTPVNGDQGEEEFTTLPDGTKVYGSFDKVKILNYSATTERKLPYEVGGGYWPYKYEKIADGFVYSENASRYKVNVTVKNIAGEPLDTIRIDVKYYDNLDNLLRHSHEYEYDLYMGDTKEVSFTWYNDSYGYYHPYFEYVDHIGGFEISVS